MYGTTHMGMMTTTGTMMAGRALPCASGAG